MSNRKRLLVVVCSCLLVGQSFGQNQVRPILERIQDTFASVDRAHMIFTTDYFHSAKDELPFKTEKAEMWMDKGLSKVKTDQLELLSNENYFITVNHGMRLIQYQKKQMSVSDESIQMTKMFDLDSLMKKAPDIELISEGPSEIHLRLLALNDLIRQMDVYINQVSYLVRKMEFQYNQELLGNPLWVRISYPLIDINPKLKSELFNENQYFLEEENEIKPATSWKEYSIQETVTTELN